MIHKQTPQTQGGRLLKRGDTFDIEDWHTTHRLRVGQSILLHLGVKAEWPEHSPECGRHPSNLSNVVFSYRESVCCSCGRDNLIDSQGPKWPEWATGRIFDLAYSLADELQTERGHWNQRQAWELKEARSKAEWIGWKEGQEVARYPNQAAADLALARYEVESISPVRQPGSEAQMVKEALQDDPFTSNQDYGLLMEAAHKADEAREWEAEAAPMREV